LLLCPLWAAAQEMVLPLSYFGQTLDWPWGGDFMGDSRALVADNGCVITCAAMCLSYYGIDTDPGRLNADLLGNSLYAPMSFRGERLGRMGFSYESIPKLYPQIRGLKMRGAVRSDSDAEALRLELAAGRPVIATVLFRKTYNHAIVIYGQRGDDFLVRDPMDPKNTTLGLYNKAAQNGLARALDCVIGTAVYSKEAR
jgi:hypothetical protein